VGGGYNNEAFSDYATVGGGQYNAASGSNSVVPGGYKNEAGTNSFAAGSLAKAIHQYSFVWGGYFEPSEAVTTRSTNDNSFTVRAPGGARFLSTTNTSSFVGVILTNAATAWASLSDSNSKTDFETINPREILSKVAALPVTAWHYKHDRERRYIGPMAQDFRAAFGLGSDDKTISTLDSDGVMYAAIQGLVEELKERDKKIKELETKSAEFQAKACDLDALKAELRALREQVQSALPPGP
jgi:hypothetical protein